MAQHGTTQLGTMQHNTMTHTKCTTTQHSTTQHSTAQQKTATLNLFITVLGNGTEFHSKAREITETLESMLCWYLTYSICRAILLVVKNTISRVSLSIFNHNASIRSQITLPVVAFLISYRSEWATRHLFLLNGKKNVFPLYAWKSMTTDLFLRRQLWNLTPLYLGAIM